jgi:hypothetical protein
MRVLCTAPDGDGHDYSRRRRGVAVPPRGAAAHRDVDGPRTTATLRPEGSVTITADKRHDLYQALIDILG